MKKPLLYTILALVVLAIAACVYFALRPASHSASPEPTSDVRPSATPQSSTAPVSSTPIPTQQPTAIPPTGPSTGELSSARPAQTDEEEGNAIAQEEVYLKPSDRTYHRKNCALAQSGTTPATRSSAVMQGYQACKICKP